MAVRRTEEIMEQQAGISSRRLQKRLGRTYTVLVDGFDQDSGLYYGRSYGETPEIDGVVFFLSEGKCATGDFVQVRMDRADVHDLYGIEI